MSTHLGIEAGGHPWRHAAHDSQPPQRRASCRLDLGQPLQQAPHVASTHLQPIRGGRDNLRDAHDEHTPACTTTTCGSPLLPLLLLLPSSDHPPPPLPTSPPGSTSSVTSTPSASPLLSSVVQTRVGAATGCATTRMLRCVSRADSSRPVSPPSNCATPTSTSPPGHHHSHARAAALLHTQPTRLPVRERTSRKLLSRLAG